MLNQIDSIKIYLDEFQIVISGTAVGYFTVR
jgi:hypothetical protein